MSWHYRVLRHPDGSLALHEVYCDEAGQPNGYTEQPIGFVANEEEGLSGIVQGLEVALEKRARPTDPRRPPDQDAALIGKDAADR